jgi:hypothetical protein
MDIFLPQKDGIVKIEETPTTYCRPKSVYPETSGGYKTLDLCFHRGDVWIPSPVPDPIRDSQEFEESAERSDANDDPVTYCGPGQ